MNELILLLLGYRTYIFDKGDFLTLSKLLLKNNFPLKIKSQAIKIPLYKCKKFERIASPRVKFSRTQPKGIGGFVLNNMKNIPFLVSVLVICAIWYVSSLVVWDIRVSGNESVKTETVIDELYRAGLKRGVFWNSIDKSEIELSVLSSSDTVSWININREGTVAYVRVADKLWHNDEEPTGYSNVIADCDGVVEELLVRKGRAMVKAGDTVKKGDLLISGILADGGFTYACGTVIARKSETVSVKIESQYEQKELLEENLHGIYVKFFDKEINILKIPRNLDTDCDIIRLDKSFTFFDKELPISYSLEKVQRFQLCPRSYSDDELVYKAAYELNQRINERLENGTLLKISCDGKFENGAYLMWADIIYSENIAVNLPFYTE